LLHAVKRIKNRKNETVILFARVMSINGKDTTLVWDPTELGI